MEFYWKNPGEAECYQLADTSSDEGQEQLNVLLHPFDVSQHQVLRLSGYAKLYSFDGSKATGKELHLVHDRCVQYREFLDSCIRKCASDDIQKVIASRVIKLSGNLDVFTLFKELATRYINAFVYLLIDDGVSHIGASPELLLRVENSQVHSTALAGTMDYENGKDIESWGQKEIEEQEYVEHFVLDTFNTYCKSITKGPKRIKRNGSICHIETPISGEIRTAEQLPFLLDDLHPTPAVCGLPKKKAFDWINRNEGYDRRYYTGYIGIESPKSSVYYVNLRCLRFANKETELYVGGGITAESVLESEFRETQLKSEVLLSAIREVHTIIEHDK